MLHKSKQALRAAALEQRDSLSWELRVSLDAAIMNNLLSLKAYADAHRVMFYASYKTEVGTMAIIKQALKANKEVVLPKVIKETVSLSKHVINGLHQVKPGYMGIPEPTTEAGMKVEQMDVLIIPGVAFSTAGARIGYGGGYYDRLLPRVKGTKPIIALAYEQQIFESLPTEAHDIGMDIIITPERVIYCHG